MRETDLPRCDGCHATLPEGARFCPSCGRSQNPVSNTQFESTARAHDNARDDKPGNSTLPPMRLPPGTQLSVYRVETVLGEGGMGVVYRGRDEALDRPVAIKCLHTNLTGSPQIRRRFVREARVLRSWSHPNVVGVYDLVEHEHLLAIVMEFIEGPNLSQHLARRRGNMPFDEIRGLFGGVLDAMEEGHRQGIVHRDLKPDNILVTTTDEGLRPKIVDFGIAKLLEGTTYTVSGALIGTCAYMAPEQVKKPETADARSDIYSLGVTLYQMCTGRVPFASGNHFAVMMAHVTDAPEPPSRLRGDLPPALDALILDALAKDPAARPPSCASFRERLDEALADLVPEPRARAISTLPPVLRDKTGDEMILVPEGNFQMGPDRRQVYLDAFYLDRTPVTNRQFKVFVDVTGYRPTDPGAHRFLAHFRNGKIPDGHEEHPVIYVSWLDARAYATWAGKRLPTEAEWEKAARGTDGRRYPWGRSEPGRTRANFGKQQDGTAPVGSFPGGASPYGILDLAGNVWEWCEDYDDALFYADGPAFNPRNTRRPDKPLYVMRGGSWMYGSQSLRTWARTSFEAYYRFAGGGFRCARTPG